MWGGAQFVTCVRGVMLLGAFLACLAVAPGIAHGFDARVSWSPVSGVAGYRVYVRQSGQASSTMTDVGLLPADLDGVIRYILRDLPNAVVSYVYLTAYDTAGRESAPSQELPVSAPSLTPGTATATAAQTSTMTGTPIRTATVTASASRTGTVTATPSRSGTATASPAASPTRTATASATRTGTITRTPTRTGTRTLSPTPTRTPTGLRFGISGGVTYLGSTAPVSSVVMTLTGAGGPLSATTDTVGQFGFASVLQGTWQLTPSRQGGWQGAVSAYDASYVLKTIAGIRTLDAVAAQACDATGNGTLTGVDASRILQLVVGQIDRLPVAQACGSDWLFVPAPTGAQQRSILPVLTSASCQRGALAYEPLQASQTGQNFVAIAFGDCTANWPSAASTALRRRSATNAAVTLGRPRSRPGGRWIIPLHVHGLEHLDALEAYLQLDPAVVQLESVRLAAAAEVAMVRHHTDTSGLATVAVAGAEPLSVGARPVVLLIARSADAPQVTLLGAVIDDQPAEIVE